MRLPNSHEALTILEEIAILTRLPRFELAGLCGISRKQWSSMNEKPIIFSAARCREIRSGVMSAVREKLDPFNPPVIGYERAWVEHCRSTRIYIDEMLNDILAAALPRKKRKRALTDARDSRQFKQKVYNEQRVRDRAEVDDGWEDSGV